ncbi:hypothetical protein HanPSC8_Chr17g0747891 [Helianthus annuus]|nr:hypothetical protein HanPSC8_Chr17g0747891 [Helianthus annuus]
MVISGTRERTFHLKRRWVCCISFVFIICASVWQERRSTIVISRVCGWHLWGLRKLLEMKNRACFSN